MLFRQTGIDNSYVKIRWQEPYTSAGLNNKSFGVYPVGVYQGFSINPGGLSGRDIVVGHNSVSGNVGTGLQSGYVSGNFDATVGFSIAVLQDPTGFQETVQIPPTGPLYHLDATGLEGKKVFIILTTTYGIGNTTTASVSLVDGPYIDANPWVVVLGYVNVPANPATPLDATMFAYNDINYPRLTPLATPTKPGLMPPSIFGQIGQNASPWEQNLLVMDVDPNNPYVIQITPSQYVVNGKRIYSYVQASVASKFPRNAAGLYNGGPANNQLAKMNVQTGVIGGAHQVSTNLSFQVPSVSGTPNAWQVGLVSIDGADNVNVIYGNVFSSVTGATLDDNLPVAGSSLLQIGAFVIGTDVSGGLLPMLASVSGAVSGFGPILSRRPFLNVGGGGTGNANELLTRLQERLVLSPFGKLCDNIFTQQGTGKVSSSTATFDVANNVYTYKLVGQNIVSTQSLATDFLSPSNGSMPADIGKVEVIDFWSVIDPAHTVEVSRDGGFSFQSVPMVQIGTTDTFRGIYQFTDETSFPVLVVQNTGTDTIGFNASTQQQLAQPFTLSAVDVITQLTLNFNVIGSPAGTFKIRIVKDNSGFPSLAQGDILCETYPIEVSSLPSGVSAQTYRLSNTVVPAGNYWITVVPDVIYQQSYSVGVTEMDVRSNNSALTMTAKFNGTSWSNVSLSAWRYQLNGRPLDLRVRITSGSNNVKLEGYGIYYSFTPGVQTGAKNVEVQGFSGDDNINQFTIHNFLPDADMLKVLFNGSGLVFTFPDFAIDGQVITFPANSFNFPGEDLRIRFDQSDGQGFDNSDQNAALLTDNHLGSPNIQNDRSVAGRGIYLRRPDGTLRELTLDDNDRIQIWSV